MENKFRANNGLGRPCLENPLHKIMVRVNPRTKEKVEGIGSKKIRELIAKAMEDKMFS